MTIDLAPPEKRVGLDGAYIYKCTLHTIANTELPKVLIYNFLCWFYQNLLYELLNSYMRQ